MESLYLHWLFSIAVQGIYTYRVHKVLDFGFINSGIYNANMKMSVFQPLYPMYPYYYWALKVEIS